MGVNAVKNQIKKGNAQNPKAMIKTALKERWKDENMENKKDEESTTLTKRKESFLKYLGNLFKR